MEGGLTNLNVQDQVVLFNNNALNVLKNYIMHETIILDDKDPHGSIKESSPQCKKVTYYRKRFAKTETIPK